MKEKVGGEIVGCVKGEVLLIFRAIKYPSFEMLNAVLPRTFRFKMEMFWQKGGTGHQGGPIEAWSLVKGSNTFLMRPAQRTG
jgi:hypothetical protein